jgi:hypothetical protein
MVASMLSLPYFCTSSKFFSMVRFSRRLVRLDGVGPAQRPPAPQIYAALHKKSTLLFATQNADSLLWIA